MKYLLLLNILPFLFSCSSYSLIRIKTNPENAQISLRTSDGEMKVLGRGNIEMSSQQFFSLGSRMAKLEVTKENYKTQSLYVVQGKAAESYEIFVKLDREMEDARSSEIRTRMEKLGKLLAKASNAIHSRRYSEAEITLNNLASEYSSISVVYDLLGNLNYLQKNMKAALGYYQRSYEINPENIETKNMIDRLSRITDWGD